MKKNKGIFENVYFLNEEGVAASLVALGISCALAAGKTLIEKRKKRLKKEKPESAEEIQARLKEIEEENAKRRKDNEKVIEDIKRLYNITIEETDQEFSTYKELLDSMIKDGKQWLSKIVNSKIFNEIFTELLQDKEKINELLEMYGNTKLKLDLNYFKKSFFIKEGLADYSIQFCDDEQFMQRELDWVGQDLAKMYSIKYYHYIGTADTGNFDQGHIFFTNSDNLD